MVSSLGNEHRTRTKKKTRQGSGRGTKLGNIGSSKHYVKKNRGQGGRNR